IVTPFQYPEKFFPGKRFLFKWYSGKLQKCLIASALFHSIFFPFSLDPKRERRYRIKETLFMFSRAERP
ncbi:hypothetical protein, partial [Bilophila wadsworthia]|uniref:hypothetical protein n=1 Tax=Bilophila wadsworthia TaxID=35833 RepID=UPI003AB79B0E